MFPDFLETPPNSAGRVNGTIGWSYEEWKRCPEHVSDKLPKDTLVVANLDAQLQSNIEMPYVLTKFLYQLDLLMIAGLSWK